MFDDNGGWDYLEAFRPPGEEWIEVAGEQLLAWRPTKREYWQWEFGGISPGGSNV